MKNYILGLDVGIASVGWGIINSETNKIIDSGVRIFREGTAEENEKRRSYRSTRRLIRRREQRIKDLKNILEKNNIINDSFIPLDNPYEIRIKGLKEKLSNDELATAILHIGKNRGLINEEMLQNLDDEKIKENETSKQNLSHNRNELKKKKYYVCELQKERLDNGKVRGFNNIFLTEDYIKEIKQIFKNQNLSKDVQEELISIIKRKREYYEGPGSEKSPTPYGRFYFENGKLIKVDLIEKMRGKCTIYSEELRAPKMAYTSDLFNILNDFNNLSINGEKVLNPDDKHLLINEYINKKGNITPKELAKYLNVDINDIKGFRENKKEEPILTEFKGYKKILNCVKKNNLSSVITEDKELVDNIITILTSKKGIEERKDALLNYSKELTEKDAITLASISGITGYHSLSFKVMKEVIDDLFETENNQMEIFSMNKYFEQNNDKLKGLKNIPTNNDDVLSPVAKTSIKETIKIINAIRKEYGELESIIIEMPREKNSEERRKKIRSMQLKNEELNKKAEKLLNGKKANLSLKQKLRLYEEQDGKCLYSGKAIDLKSLINYPHLYEIDHIIPLSISLDDSFNNKVLVYREENQQKGNNTPYLYFKNRKNNNYNYEDYKNIVLQLAKNKKIPKRRKENLLFEEDINKFEVRKKFINRNLVDTRYASRSILNTLTNYFKVNGINTTVHTVRGNTTNLFRKKSDLKKVRDEDHKHHAVDALIVAGIKKQKLFNEMLKISIQKNNDEIIRYDEKTGEIITKDNEKEFFNNEFLNYIDKLENLEIKYSHKVDRKINRSISNETIYSTKNFDGIEWIIGKSNLYTEEKISKMFRNGTAKEKLLMYKQDPKTFEILKKIAENYPKADNPFKEHLDLTGEVIRKYSKNNKGPIINEIKYLDKKLGNYLDISNKYNIKKDNKVVLLSLTPYRIDLYKNKNNEYVFIQIYQHHIKYKKNKAYIPNKTYEALLKEQKITKEDEFIFSIYKNETLLLEPYDNLRTYNGRILYAGVQNLNDARIYYYSVNKSTLILNDEVINRPYITLKKLTNIKKIHTDILGNEYIITKESEPKLILN